MSQEPVVVIGCDPGYRQSTIVAFDGVSVLDHRTMENAELLAFLADPELLAFLTQPKRTVLVIEQMQVFSSNYGIGQEIFDSVFWSGRFAQAWSPRRFDRILRSKVRGHLQASKGGDAAVRASLISRFGPYKETAIGLKATPGPLFGITSHKWAALAIAVVWSDLHGYESTDVRPGIQPEF